jgi:hypothetical protein
MKSCTNCKYAEWKKTASGRLHPSGDGRCQFTYKLPPLPQSMYWIGSPSPCGGHINRKNDLKDHCVYYAPAA